MANGEDYVDSRARWGDVVSIAKKYSSNVCLRMPQGFECRFQTGAGGGLH